MQTTIKINKNTLEILKAEKIANTETYNTVINRLIQENKELQAVKEQNKQLINIIANITNAETNETITEADTLTEAEKLENETKIFFVTNNKNNFFIKAEYIRNEEYYYFSNDNINYSESIDIINDADLIEQYITVTNKYIGLNTMLYDLDRNKHLFLNGLDICLYI